MKAFFLLICILLSGTVFSDEFYSYDEMLGRAEYYMEWKNASEIKDPAFRISEPYRISEEILQKADTKFEKKDFRFYRLRGKLYRRTGRISLAEKDFETSLSMKPEDTETSLALFEICLEDERLAKAFDYARIHLAENPENRKVRYEALVLSAGLGEMKYFKFASDRLSKGHSPEEEAEVLKKITKLQADRKYSDCAEESEKSLIHFPLSENLYRTAVQCLKETDVSGKRTGRILLNAAVLFPEKRKHLLAYSEYLKKMKKYPHSLNVLRKVFSDSLKKDGEAYDREIVFLLRNVYTAMGREKDAYALSLIAESSRTSRKLDSAALLQNYRIYENRETLLLLIHSLKSEADSAASEKYSEMLRQRDEKMRHIEFTGIFPVFSSE